MNNNNFNQPNPMINNLMNLMSMGQNPQQIIQNAIARNPQLQQTFTQMQQNNISPREMCMQIARQRGLDLTPAIQFMNQRGMKI